MDRGYVVRRTGEAAFTVWAVVTITFVMIRLLPGDARALLGVMLLSGGGAGGAGVSHYLPDQAATTGPIWTQYIVYVTNVFQGDLGTSVFYQRPVATILAEAVPYTIFVITVALVLTFGIGITLGAILAYKEGSRLDVAVSTLATVLNSIPYYIAAVLMVYVLGYHLDAFPTTGKFPPGTTPGLSPPFVLGLLYHASLPIISIVVTGFGFRALSMRGNSLQALGENYVRVATLRGLSDRRIALQYVGRNAVLPMYTGLMIAIGTVIGGAVIIEEIFQYRGLGFYFFKGISARDYPLVMGAFIVISLTVVIGLYIADLTYGLIDPRASTGADTAGSRGSRASTRARLLGIAASVRRFSRTLAARLIGSREPPPSDRRRQVAPVAGQSVFQTTSNVERSRVERYERTVHEYLIAPVKIIWEDTRTRLGSAILLSFILAGTIGVWFVDAPHTNQAPIMLGAFVDPAHPLGSNVTGQDLLALVVHSTSNMVEMMLSGAVFATVVATVIGLVSGYSRGRLDEFLMLVSDVVLTIPGLPLVMVLAIIFEPRDPWLVGLLLAINAWGGTARQIRSQVLATGRESYVEASGIMSLSLPTILLKDILPNIAPFVIVRFVQLAREVIIASVALYFLGVLPFTNVNWGVMLNMAYKQGALYSLETAHMIVVPIVPIVLLIYGLILFAQGTDRIFNPQIRARHMALPQTEEAEGRDGPDLRDITPGDD